MIYKKLPYTRPPMRAVTGTRYCVTLTVGDAVFNNSFILTHLEQTTNPYWRRRLGLQLRLMRAALRQRAENYAKGVEI